MHRFDLTYYNLSKYGGYKYGKDQLAIGTYKTKMIQTGRPIYGTFDISYVSEVMCIDVLCQDEEFEYGGEGTWELSANKSYMSNSNAFASCLFHCAGSKIDLVVPTGPNLGTMAYAIKDRTSANVSSGTINLNSPTDGTFTKTITFPSLDHYYITFTNSTGTNAIAISSAKVYVTEVRAKIATTVDKVTFETPYYLNMTYVPAETKFSGSSRSYAEASQKPTACVVTLELVSGSWSVSPEVTNFSVTSADAGYTTTGGQWSIIKDLGAKPQSLDTIIWSSSVPAGTTMKIYTKTSPTADMTHSPISLPYEMEKYQVRLTNDALTGEFITKEFAPSFINEFCKYQYIEYHSEQNITNYTTSSIESLLSTYDEHTGLFSEIELRDGIDISKYNINNTPIRFKYTITRPTINEVSPTISGNSISVKVVYDQNRTITQHNTNGKARACKLFVEDPSKPTLNLGDRSVVAINDMGFNVPQNITTEKYTLTDNSGRTEAVKVYWSSNKDNKDLAITSQRSDVLWAYVHTSTIHKFFNKGVAYYLEDEAQETEIASIYYPPIPENNSDYAYRLINGWRQQEDITNINQSVLMHWTLTTTDQLGQVHGPGEDYDPAITEKSKRNNYLVENNPTNDTIWFSSQVGYTVENQDWVSDIYNYNDNILNANYDDIKQDYGATIALPKIPVSVQVDESPYEIEIIKNSVRQVAGDQEIVVPEERVSVEFEPIESISTVQNRLITKSEDEVDYLPDSRITDVIKISDEYNGDPSYYKLVYRNLLSIFGNFETATNGIGAGWTPNGATGSINENTQKIVATNTTGYHNMSINSLEAIQGHKYYITGKIHTATEGSNAELVVNMTQIGVTNKQEWQKVSVIYTCEEGYLIIVGGILDYEQKREFLGSDEEAYFREIAITDLTAQFGSGNEPTIEWCDNNIKFTTNYKMYISTNMASAYALFDKGVNVNGIDIGFEFPTGLTGSVINKTQKFVASDTNLYHMADLPITEDLIANNVYYVRLMSTSEANGAAFIQLMHKDGSNNDVSSKDSTATPAQYPGYAMGSTNIATYQTVSMIHKFTTVNVDHPEVKLRINIADETASGDKTNFVGAGQSITFKEPFMVNLTEIFGAGAEPDKAWCDQNFVFNTITNGKADYIVVNNSIEWINGSNHPLTGSKYYVDYNFIKSLQANVRVSCDYMQAVRSRQLWSSSIELLNYYNNKEHETPVSCKPGDDFIATLPAPSDYELWDDIPQNVTDLFYRITDDNPLVHTYIKPEADGTYKLVGTLNENIPSRNWHPLVHDGYYYHQKDEYWKYNSIRTYVINNSSMDAINKKISISTTPKGGSPILVDIPNKNFRQVAFTNDKGEYVTYLKENLEIKGKDIRLSYNNIDPAYVISIVTEKGQILQYIDENYNDNIISLAVYEGEPAELRKMNDGEAQEYIGQRVDITYQPKECFVVDYNASQGDTVNIIFSEYTNTGNIYYEGSNDENSLIESMDLNPIVSSRNAGFMYIDYDNKPTKYISINVYPDKIKVKEIAILYIQTFDEEGNPVIDTPVITASDGTSLITEDLKNGTYVVTYRCMKDEAKKVKVTVRCAEVAAEALITIVREKA